MMSLTERLLLVTERYCAAVGRSRARISTLIFGGGDRIEGVAAGKDINTRSYEKAMAWFAANWPADLDWPEGVERPHADAPETGKKGDAGQRGAAA